MKKVLFALIFVAFIFGCKSEDNSNNNEPIDKDTTILEDKVIVEKDTTIINLTEEEANLKSDVMVKKSEEINNKLDELLENL